MFDAFTGAPGQRCSVAGGWAASGGDLPATRRGTGAAVLRKQRSWALPRGFRRVCRCHEACSSDLFCRFQV